MADIISAQITRADSIGGGSATTAASGREHHALEPLEVEEPAPEQEPASLEPAESEDLTRYPSGMRLVAILSVAVMAICLTSLVRQREAYDSMKVYQ